MRIEKYAGEHAKIRRDLNEVAQKYGDVTDGRPVLALRHALAYCVGRYGAVDETVYEVIVELRKAGVIE